MGFEIATHGQHVFTITTKDQHHWCGPEQKARLEAYGFQFGPMNAHGFFRLCGPVTCRSDYGIEFYEVVVHLQTLEEMVCLLTTLRSVYVVTGEDAPDGDYAFLMSPQEDVT